MDTPSLPNVLHTIAVQFAFASFRWEQVPKKGFGPPDTTRPRVGGAPYQLLLAQTSSMTGNSSWGKKRLSKFFLKILRAGPPPSVEE